MRPILYEATETAFKTNGICRPNFTSCLVTEELNNKYELEAEISTADKHFNEIDLHKILLVSTGPDEPYQPFQIYKIKKQSNGMKATINAEHISYRLSGIPVTPFTANTPSEALTKIKSNSVTSNPFTFYTNVVYTVDNSVKLKIEEPKTAKSLLGDDASAGILGVFKTGEYKYDKFKVSLLERRGEDTDVKLRYGKDIASLSQEEDMSDMYIGILPYYPFEKSGSSSTKYDASGNTIASGGHTENGIMYLTDRVYYSDNASKFPNGKIELVDVSSEFDGQPSESTLLEWCKKYTKLNKIGEPNFSIDLDFAQLWLSKQYATYEELQSLHMGDAINVIFPTLDITATGEITSYKWNVLTGAYESMEIGNSRKGIYHTIQNLTKSNVTYSSSKNQDTTVTGNINVEISKGTTSMRLLTNLECDALLGLVPHTSNNTNTTATFTNADDKGGQYFTNFYYNGDGWYGNCSTDNLTETINTRVAYSLFYYGEKTT